MVSLAATPEPAKPHPAHFPTEAAQTLPIAGHRVVVEEALHHAAQPPPLIGHRLMPPTAKLLFHRRKLPPQTLFARVTVHPESARVPRPPSHMREAEELERLRFPFTPSGSIARGVPTECQQARLFGMKVQPELRKPLSPLDRVAN